MRKSFDDGDHEASAPRKVPGAGTGEDKAAARPSLLERVLTLEMLAVVLLVLLTYWMMAF